MPVPKVYRNRPAPDPKPQVEVEGKLDVLTKDELYEMAQEHDIPGRSSMTKDELIQALS